MDLYGFGRLHLAPWHLTNLPVATNHRSLRWKYAPLCRLAQLGPGMGWSCGKLCFNALESFFVWVNRGW